MIAIGCSTAGTMTEGLRGQQGFAAAVLPLLPEAAQSHRQAQHQHQQQQQQQRRKKQNISPAPGGASPNSPVGQGWGGDGNSAVGGSPAYRTRRGTRDIAGKGRMSR